VTEWLPQLEISTDYFGIWVRRGAPPEVIATMERIWVERIAKSAVLQGYARQNGAIFTPLFGAEARARSWDTIIADAWALHHLGVTKRSPDELGIPKP
jgi:hypothetical protein